VNQSVDDHLERLNATRFTATSYADEQRVRSADVLRRPVSATRDADPSPTVTADAVLIDFGFLWIVFLMLDLFLVTRRIGNMFRIKSVLSLLRVCTDTKHIFYRLSGVYSLSSVEAVLARAKLHCPKGRKVCTSVLR